MSLDGKAQPGTTPMRLDLPARSYELKVDCAGLGARKTVVVAHNSKTAVQLRAWDDAALRAQKERAATQRIADATAARRVIRDIGVELDNLSRNKWLGKGPKIFAGVMFGAAGALTAAGVASRVNTGWAAEQAATAQSPLAYQFAVDNIHDGNAETGVLVGAALTSAAAGILAAVVSGARAKQQRKLKERRDALRRQLDERGAP